MQLNYHHLHYFYVIAREGSISRAAHCLNVTPQTVSGQLTTFEHQLGGLLFERKGKRLVLNARGKTAYQYAEEIFSLGEELQGQLRLKSPGTLNRITLAVTDVIPKILAFDLVKPLFAALDSTRLIYREGELDSLLAQLALNRVDLILSDRPLPPGANVKAFSHFLGESPLCFFAKAQSSYARQPFPACLEGAPLLLSGDKSTMRVSVMAYLENQGIRPKVLAEIDDSAVLKLLGQQGYGVFCAPACIAGHVCEQHQVSQIGVAGNITERYYLITPERKIQSPQAQQIALSAARFFAV
ncbi:transcriptional activator NhaR [Bowmanella denitrificans]|uniref:Transcriptional activator NhaR n=1 Tax=Bowmanella denitrificans TaxID=366582 RepID=A0ABP3GNE2_9ALTE|nr:LysR family transcriptional regulator [Bowmanella denitrificans]